MPAADTFTPPPRPTATFEITLTDEQIAAFHADGFTSVDRITTDEELEWLRTIYDFLFTEKLGGAPGLYFDLSRPYDADGDDLLPQVLVPERRFPELLDTVYAANCRRIAEQLLIGDEPTESDPLTMWGHMIRKPPLVGHETPWHQDESYWDVHFDYHAVGFWMPLDEATVESGCMQFVPGSNQGEVLPHRHINDDPAVHGLWAEGVDSTRRVAIPLRPGGATMHHPRTLHYTAPNTTENARRAYAIELQFPPTRRSEPADKPWVIDGQEAWSDRKFDWK